MGNKYVSLNTITPKLERWRMPALETRPRLKKDDGEKLTKTLTSCAARGNVRWWPRGRLTLPGSQPSFIREQKPGARKGCSAAGIILCLVGCSTTLIFNKMSWFRRERFLQERAITTLQLTVLHHPQDLTAESRHPKTPEQAVPDKFKGTIVSGAQVLCHRSMIDTVLISKWRDLVQELLCFSRIPLRPKSRSFAPVAHRGKRKQGTRFLEWGDSASFSLGFSLTGGDRFVSEHGGAAGPAWGQRGRGDITASLVKRSARPTSIPRPGGSDCLQRGGEAHRL